MIKKKEVKCIEIRKNSFEIWKIKIGIKEFFYIFTMMFFAIIMLAEGQFDFWPNIKKIWLVYAQHESIYERHLCPSSDVCGASLSSKPTYVTSLEALLGPLSLGTTRVGGG